MPTRLIKKRKRLPKQNARKPKRNENISRR